MIAAGTKELLARISSPAARVSEVYPVYLEDVEQVTIGIGREKKKQADEFISPVDQISDDISITTLNKLEPHIFISSSQSFDNALLVSTTTRRDEAFGTGEELDSSIEYESSPATPEPANEDIGITIADLVYSSDNGSGHAVSLVMPGYEENRLRYKYSSVHVGDSTPPSYADTVISGEWSFPGNYESVLSSLLEDISIENYFVRHKWLCDITSTDESGNERDGDEWTYAADKTVSRHELHYDDGSVVVKTEPDSMYFPEIPEKVDLAEPIRNNIGAFAASDGDILLVRPTPPPIYENARINDYDNFDVDLSGLLDGDTKGEPAGVLSDFIGDELASSGSGDDLSNNDLNFPFDNAGKSASCSGLREEYLDMMRKLKEKTGSEYAEEYAKGLAEIASGYFTKGVMGTTTHAGGTYNAVGVGTKVLTECTAMVPQCIQELVDYYMNNKDNLNSIDEGKTIAEAYSKMFDGGTYKEMVMGIWIQPGSPPVTMPLAEPNQSYTINSSAGKPAFMAIYSAVCEALNKMADGINKTGSSEPMTALGINTSYSDSDDLIATALAAGVKAMIAMTRISTTSIHSTVGGNGVLVPIGP